MFLELDPKDLGVANFAELCKEVPGAVVEEKPEIAYVRYDRNVAHGKELFHKLCTLAKELDTEIDVNTYSRDGKWLVDDLKSDIAELTQDKCEKVWEELQALAKEQKQEVKKE